MKIKQTGFIKKKKAGATLRSVCFNCRKCFHNSLSLCVDCKQNVYSVGYFFTAPRKNELKKWKIIEKMVVNLNYHFSKHGASGPMPTSIVIADNMISKDRRSREPKLHKNKMNKEKDKILPLFWE